MLWPSGDSSTNEIFTLSLHDALPILSTATVVPEAAVTRIDQGLAIPFTTACILGCCVMTGYGSVVNAARVEAGASVVRSEEHTSELQSHVNLVCRLLLEKKNEHAQST